MPKTRLCGHDEDKIIDLMESINKVLSEVGIIGEACFFRSSDGDVRGNITIDEKTALYLSVEKDGDKTVKEYLYDSDCAG